MTRRIALVFLALALCARALAAPIADGPYVMAAADGGWVAHWVEGDDSAPKAREQRLSKKSSVSGRVLTIPAVGHVPAFKVTLRNPETGPRAISPDEITLPEGSRTAPLEEGVSWRPRADYSCGRPGARVQGDATES